MYGCTSCGAGLRYDIRSEKLLCDYCGASFDPYEYEKAKDAEEKEYFDTTIFTCPQCGGEVISTDDTAAGFCSFCGASTILDARLSGSRRPEYIIPFQLDKEDCKKAYAHFMRRAFFAPAEFRDGSGIERLRGIYVPYWVYRLTYGGRALIRGSESERKGDYVYKYNYDLNADVDMEYRGISYDASSSFNDPVSETIAPYHAVRMRPFTPSFLCGFYADTADVAPDVYSGDAMKFGSEEVFAVLKGQEEFRKLSPELPKKEDDRNRALCMTDQTAENGLFPVWFMTFRRGKRVAYFVMNGETGKIAADVPVDIRKFLAGAGVLAVPMFFLLNLFLSMRAQTGLVLVMLVSACCFLLSGIERARLKIRDERTEDRGYQSLFGDPGKKKAQDKKKKAGSPNGVQGFKPGPFGIFCIAAAVLIVPIGLYGITFKGLKVITVILSLAAAGICAGGYLAAPEEARKDVLKKSLLYPLQLVLAAAVLFYMPVRDLMYYIPSLVLLADACVILICMISSYNLLSTRPLPHYIRKGGDDRA